MNEAFIELTHTGLGAYGGQKPYTGAVILAISRIESVEVVNIEGESPITWVTMKSGAAHGVSESADRVWELMSQAAARLH